MGYECEFKNLDIDLELQLQNKWLANSIPIHSDILDIKEKMPLYHDDKYSNYWNIREILLTEPLNYFRLKEFLYMRYGGDELAKKTLEDMNTLDPSQSYRILNAGSGFGSDMIEQAKILPNAKFCGIEFNKRYADLSAKIIQALGLEDRIKIYNANLAEPNHMKEIQNREGIFDAAYSNLVILHIDNKSIVYHLIFEMLKKGGIFRNEDYIKQNKTDLKFAAEKIGCQNLKTLGEMIKIAEKAGFNKSHYIDLTENWKEFTLQRLSEYSKINQKISKKKEVFFKDAADYFSEYFGCGGVFKHVKE
ncbi:methyltransferase domain-containing protein [Fluviispira multicolorata]|uniref:Methyltransferase domain-containing protein n=1 Tax=Fluviispira multicolorata TaxID=2654512 RepID=A0A833N3G1_9BACT|nr:methyltransferase domain-containing protein [Fluviispira multicolorata]KAB8029864.1 methyltransferase domain-containing protein [Fluviispira multicolorata]